MLKFHLKTCIIKSLFVNMNMLLALYESQEYISYIGKKLLELQGVYYFCFILFCQEQSFCFSGSMHSQFQSKRPFANILKENRILAKKTPHFSYEKDITFSLNINGRRIWRKSCRLYPRVPLFIPFWYLLMRIHEEKKQVGWIIDSYSEISLTAE